MDSTQSQASTPLELFKLGTIAAVVIACGFLSTALATRSETVQRIAPWVAGEGFPVVRLFTASKAEHAALPSFAEASGAPAASADGKTAAAEAAAEATEEIALGETGGVGPAAGIAPTEYEGATQPIEGAEHLASFFAQLTRTLKREPKAITRIAHYGDSAVAADSITSTARRMLQARFGDSGHGFILIARGSMQHYMHRDIVHRSTGEWEIRSIVHGELRDGHYGYGGVLARGGSGASATFATVDEGNIGTKVSRFSLFYQRGRGGGSVQIRVDGEPDRTISAAGDAIEDAVETVEVPDGSHQFSLRMIGNQTKLYGVALERDTTGVVYDSLGLLGAMAERLLEADPEHIAAQIQQRDPHLLVLGFGGNESANAWLNIENYEAGLHKVVKQMRAGKPQMACLLFGPLDQAERDARGKVATVKILPPIVAAQRRVAAAEGCAFFDTYQAMGGEGAMAKWLKTRPRLATSDMRHATPKGYEVVGTLYYKALLQAFAQYLSMPKKG